MKTARALSPGKMPETDGRGELTRRARKEFEAYLAGSGQSRTPERFAILNAVCGISGVFSAQELYGIMNHETLPVSLATVYSTLALLENARIVVRHHFDRRTVSYELAIERRGFKYMICAECGRARRVEDGMLDKSIGNVKTPRFHVESFSVYIYGVCASCASIRKRRAKALLGKAAARAASGGASRSGGSAAAPPAERRK